MKKVFIYLLGVSFLLAACDRKSDLNIDGMKTDDRVAAALKALQDKLVSAPYGWVLVEYTTGLAINQGAIETGPKASFAYYMKFDDQNKVSMISDFDSSMAATFQSSSYQIKAIQRPSLIFDTYSYIHVPCDPDPAKSNSPFGPGLGWGADFEFSFADNVGAAQIGDTIQLEGNLNHTKALLVKATQAEQTAYTTNGFKQGMAISNILNYFKRVSGASSFEITPGVGGRSFDIRYGTNPAPVNVGYHATANSIVLDTVLEIGGQTINSIDNPVWNDANKTITATINGAAVTIKGATSPLVPDPDIAGSFYDEGFNNPWLSETGFHVDGVDDAYDMKSLKVGPSIFYFFVFFPGGAGGPYDIISPYFINGDDNYPFLLTGGVSTSVVQSGRLYFQIQFFDDPSTNPPAIDKTVRLLALGQTATPGQPTINYGFFIIPKADGLSYDMVNAGGATAWVRWQHQ